MWAYLSTQNSTIKHSISYSSTFFFPFSVNIFISMMCFHRITRGVKMGRFWTILLYLYENMCVTTFQYISRPNVGLCFVLFFSLFFLLWKRWSEIKIIWNSTFSYLERKKIYGLLFSYIYVHIFPAIFPSIFPFHIKMYCIAIEVAWTGVNPNFNA